MDNSDVLIKAVNLKKSFVAQRRGLSALVSGAQYDVYAVDNVSFELKRGEVLGFIGESGCGKTTTARMLMKLLPIDKGSLLYNGMDITNTKGAKLQEYRKKAQIVFQDPYEYLNPRLNVLEIVAEPLVINKMLSSHKEKVDLVSECLEEVGLAPGKAYINRYPHELSGGQRQRVAIARALILKPELIVADEPTSMLDVSVRAGILNLLLDLKKEHKMSIVFITHDILTAGYMCDNIAVMYKGRIVEYGPKNKIIFEPRHQYTKALIKVSRELDTFLEHKDSYIVDGEVDNTAKSGYCGFKDRCVCSCDICDAHEAKHSHKHETDEYEMTKVGENHYVACCKC